MAYLRLSAAAQQDIVRLLAYSSRKFGELAGRRYEALLLTALRDSAKDPERVGSIARPDLGVGISSYHLRHSRGDVRSGAAVVRRPRHIVLYRVNVPDIVGVGRALHDSMELELHLPPRYGDE